MIFFLLGPVITPVVFAQQATEPVKIEAESQAVNKHSTRELTTFWIIGIFINLAMFSAFIIWAVKEWQKK